MTQTEAKVNKAFLTQLPLFSFLSVSFWGRSEAEILVLWDQAALQLEILEQSGGAEPSMKHEGDKSIPDDPAVLK